MVREPRSLSTSLTSSRACSFAHWCSLIMYLRTTIHRLSRNRSGIRSSLLKTQPLTVPAMHHPLVRPPKSGERRAELGWRLQTCRADAPATETPAR
jgi:hypothetical protein